MSRVSFLVPLLHCEGCGETIRDALAGVPGVSRVDVDVDSRRVTVEHDPERVTPDALRDHIRNAGFDAEFIRDEPRREREEAARRAASSAWYWLLAFGVAILALAGYIGYELYPRFELPAVQGAALLLLATGAGVASFFSPCAFPLLVTLLARETGIERGAEPRQAVRMGLAFAAALSAGAAVFLFLAGVVIAFGGGPLFAGVTFTSAAGITIRAVVGALLILLGMIQIGILRVPLHAVERLAKPLLRAEARRRRERPLLAFGIFGFAYLIAGFG